MGSSLQDVSSGKPVRVGDTNLYGMEIDVAAAAEEIRSIGKADKGKSVDDVLGSFGLGVFAEQLKDLRLSMQLSCCSCPVSLYASLKQGPSAQQGLC